MGGRAMMAPDGNAPQAVPAGSQRVLPVTMYAQVAPPTPEERLRTEQMKKEDQKRFVQAAHELSKGISLVGVLAKLREKVSLSNTPEGLRIEFMDEDAFAVFDVARSPLYTAYASLLVGGAGRFLLSA